MVVGRNKVDNSSFSMREKGFTLVELLIAIFIFAIVISSVYGSYSATFHIIQGTEFQLDVANRSRIVAERMGEDLGSIVTGPGGDFLGENHEYSGARGDSLFFVSSAHLVLRKTDIFAGHVFIQYQTELDEENGLLNLYRSETILLPGIERDEEVTQKHLICRGLQEFELTYFDRDGNEAEEWQVDEVVPASESEEPVQTQFPALVSIKLKFADSMESDASSVFKTAVALP
jgi:general secretion pathway protein J